MRSPHTHQHGTKKSQVADKRCWAQLTLLAADGLGSVVIANHDLGNRPISVFSGRTEFFIDSLHDLPAAAIAGAMGVGEDVLALRLD